MNQEIKALWVAELRDPHIKQGKGELRQGIGVETRFCCLGILCNVHARLHPDLAIKQTNPHVYFEEGTYLPKIVQQWAGLANRHGGYVYINGMTRDLARHNDNGATFLEIADAIEKQL